MRAVMRGLVSREVFRLDAEPVHTAKPHNACWPTARRRWWSWAIRIWRGTTVRQTKQRYINTGTWADLITVPDEALEDSEAGR